MIEFCTKRRMILSIIGLGLLTIIILILEETLTSDLGPNGGGTHLQNSSHASTASHAFQYSLKTSSEPIPPPEAADFPKPNVVQDNSSKACWLSEDFKVTRECSSCTKFEVSSGTPTACRPTGRKEIINCSISGVVYRSCSRLVGLEKRNFWIFESLMLLLTVLGLGFVKLRRSQLERQTIRQIERRLANGY